MPNYILAQFPISGLIPRIQHFNTGGMAYVEPTTIVLERDELFELLYRKYAHQLPLFGFNPDGSPNKDYFPWQEINFGSSNPSVQDNRVYVNGTRLDSYTIQALRKNVIPIQRDVLENAIQGMLVKSGQFMLGERGGSELAGTLQPVPGGSVVWKEGNAGDDMKKALYNPYDYDPMTDAFHAEAYEEAGATIITNVRLLGIFNQVTQHINRQWVFKGEPSESIDELIGKMQAGIIFYQQQLAAGKTGREAKLALRESGHPADAWENSDVWSFNYDAETFLYLLADGRWVNPRGIDIKLIGSLPADLYIAGVAQWGEEFKREVDKLEFVKKEIVSQRK